MDTKAQSIMTISSEQYSSGVVPPPPHTHTKICSDHRNIKRFDGESSFMKLAWTCVMMLAPGTGTSLGVYRAVALCQRLCLTPFPRPGELGCLTWLPSVVFKRLSMQARHGFSFIPTTFQELESARAAHGVCTRFRTFCQHKRS